MSRSSSGRAVNLIGLGASALLAVALAAAALPAAAQQATTSDDDPVARREQNERLIAEMFRAWPAAYPWPPEGLPGRRARPPLAGGPLQRLYPWELLGSPFVAITPLREINFLGQQPSMIDLCYGLLERHYTTPLMFRSNMSEARAYLAAGEGPRVLSAWASYLGQAEPDLRGQFVSPGLVEQTVRTWLDAGGYLVQNSASPPPVPAPVQTVEPYRPELPVCY